MKKPVLVVMAAGMGSRYGGLKQIDPVDKEGHIIMDFSIYDAVQAGFQKVVFIIKKENEADFRSAIGDRLSNQLEVSYVFQDLHNIPEGYEVPEGRVKPWGTGHAVLSCINEIDGPFVVINADDYYGSHAFKMAYDFLTENEDTADTYRYMMVGYKLENTLTENGHVARGVCVTDEEGHLLKINERTHIEKHDGGTAYTEDDGKTWTMLPEGSTVSMNMWGFSASILKELKDRFPKFLDENLKVNPLKCEYFLPFVVDELLGEKRATVKVLKSMDKWYGVTYKEDKPVVVAAILHQFYGFGKNTLVHFLKNIMFACIISQAVSVIDMSASIRNAFCQIIFQNKCTGDILYFPVNFHSIIPPIISVDTALHLLNSEWQLLPQVYLLCRLRHTIYP